MNFKRSFWLALLLCCGALAALLFFPRPVSAPNLPTPVKEILLPGSYDESILVGGMKRTYRMVIPRAYNGTPIPLVVFLHGRGGDGRNFEIACGMTRKAESAGFVVVYPDALGEPTAWNAGYNRGRISTVDDVGFIRALIQSLRQKLTVDPRRIYVGGYSSGGIMSYRLGSELSDTIAAIGVMAGTIGARLPDGSEIQIPRPAQPLSVLHIHGLLDNIVTYDGYDSLVAPGEYFPAPRSVGFWVENNGCTHIPEKESLYGGQILKDSYSGCKQGVEVSFYTLPTGDHGWPMLTNPANKSMVTGSDLMWDFFAAHPRLQPAP